MGTAVAQWLRCCATNRKVAGSIPGGVIEIFHWHKIHPIALWPWGISWGKGGRCVRLTTLPPSCTVVMNSGNFNFLEPSGPLQSCNGTALPFIRVYIYIESWPFIISVIIGRACSTSVGEEKCINNSGGESRRKETTWKSQTLHEWVISELIWKEIGWEGGRLD